MLLFPVGSAMRVVVQRQRITIPITYVVDSNAISRFSYPLPVRVVSVGNNITAFSYLFNLAVNAPVNAIDPCLGVMYQVANSIIGIVVCWLVFNVSGIGAVAGIIGYIVQLVIG